MLINLYIKKPKAATITKRENNIKKDKDIETKKYFNSIEKRHKISDMSLNNDKKLNKTIEVNLIDNIKYNSQFSKEKKNNIIQTKNINKNNKNNDISLNVIMHLDKIDNKNNGYKKNIESQNRICNLKKNNNLIIKNLDIRNKIKNFNLSNNNTNRTLFLNSKNNIINNSIIRNTINIIKKNPVINEHCTTLNQLNTIDNKDKCSISKNNVHIKNKKIKQRNLNTNSLNNQINSISGSSILNNKFETQTKTIFICNKKNNNILNLYPKLEIEQIQNNNTINENRFKNTNIESKIIYKKKSPTKLEDLSDSLRQKIYNERNKQNKKVNCEKLNSKNIFDKTQKIHLNKNKNIMKKIDINNQIIKSYKNTLNQKNDKKIIKTINNLLKENNNIPNDEISTNRKYNININGECLNKSVEKKSHKNIKFRNINIANKMRKNIYTKFNNQSYLTLNNNDNINYSHNFELSRKRIFNKINRNINANKFNN